MKLKKLLLITLLCVLWQGTAYAAKTVIETPPSVPGLQGNPVPTPGLQGNPVGRIAPVVREEIVVPHPSVEPVMMDDGGWDRRGGIWFRWIYAGEGMLPRNAVIGGSEPNRPLFVCQSGFRGGMHPGKVVDGRCNITYGGNEIPRDNYSVLVGRGLHWVWPREGFLPRNIIPGGFENGHPLFICRSGFMGGVHPGKIVAGACNIGYGGREYRKFAYQVLVAG